MMCFRRNGAAVSVCAPDRFEYSPSHSVPLMRVIYTLLSITPYLTRTKYASTLQEDYASREPRFPEFERIGVQAFLESGNSFSL